MLRHLSGLVIHFIGMGLWFLLSGWFFFWFVILVLPAAPLAFVLGYMTRAHVRSQHWPAFVSWWGWDLLRERYFQFELRGDDNGCALVQDPPPSERPVIYAIYPHGHYAITPTIYWGLNGKFSGRVVGAVHTILFYMPLLGTVVGWTGAVGATEKEIRTALDSGKSVAMTPGGVADITNRGHVVTRRSGFIRLAHATKTPIVPIWCPQERSYYNHWSPLGDLLKPLFGFPIPTIIYGRWWCPVLPRYVASPATIRVGKPLNWDHGQSVDVMSLDFYKSLGMLQHE